MQIDLKVKHQRILGVQQIPRLVVEKTTGFVYLSVEFDEEWADRNITILLSNDRCSGDAVEHPWTGEPIEVDPELLVTGVLRVSCVGLKSDDPGDTVQRLTTKRMSEGIRIYAAGDQVGRDPSTTLPNLWERVLAVLGPVQNLQTEDKSSLVGAVNEINGARIQSIEQTVFSDEDGGINEFTITQADGSKTVLQVRNGSKGDRGKPFTYSDFTPEQLEALRGPRGAAFRYDDFTPEQLEALKGPEGDPGSDISGIARTAGNGAPGTVDTYTVRLTNGKTHEFYVYNGRDGVGAGDMASDVYDPHGKKQDVFKYVDDVVGNIPTPDVSGQIGEHNTAAGSHNDIRILIAELSNRLNTIANSDDIDLDQMAELVAYIKDNRGLIEQVTTNKVNVFDIINNLTTSVSNKPLSAAQGVALKTLIDNLSSSLSNYQPKGDYALRSEIPEGFSGSWNDLKDKPSSFTPAAHNQAASTITAGTFAGQVKANAGNQTPGNYLVRNIKLSATEEAPTVNGEICFVLA